MSKSKLAENEDLENVVCSDFCPNDLGYREVLGECVKVYDEPRTYFGASDRCKEDGAHLFHFRRRAEDTNVTKEAAYGAGVYDDRLWVGADDIQTEASFRWSDGCPLEKDSDLWYGPDNEPTTNDAERVEYCVELYADFFYLNDVKCTIQRRFICQFD